MLILFLPLTLPIFLFVDETQYIIQTLVDIHNNIASLYLKTCIFQAMSNPM